MERAIRISTQRYEAIHGRKPCGYGLWYFQLPGNVYVSYPGGYATAKRAASLDALRVVASPSIFIQLCA